jgi:hypothetical protein
LHPKNGFDPQIEVPSAARSRRCKGEFIALHIDDESVGKAPRRSTVAPLDARIMRNPR